MNPDTRQLELINPEILKSLKQIPKHDPVAALKSEIEALQVAEPHKRTWTTFTIGEQVEVHFQRDGKPYYRSVRVKNIHANGLLLKAADLKDSFFPGQEVTVKGEKCRVGLLTSKGMYVRGA